MNCIPPVTVVLLNIFAGSRASGQEGLRRIGDNAVPGPFFHEQRMAGPPRMESLHRR